MTTLRLIPRHLLTLATVGTFAVLGAATTSSDGESSSFTESEDTEGANRAVAFRELETHLERASTYGEGRGAQRIANGLRDSVEPGDAIAVKVVEGPRPVVVALVRFWDEDVEGLRDLSSEERREHLDILLDDIVTLAPESADIGLGIRGSIFYGAIAVQIDGRDWAYDTSAMADTAPLEIMLAPPPPEVAEVPAEGTEAPAAEAVAQPPVAADPPAE